MRWWVFLWAGSLLMADIRQLPINDFAENLLSASDLVNLESSPQDFILETQRIEIPGYLNAYNPSIMRWQGRLLLSFRIRQPETLFYQIGLVFLDEQFRPIEPPQLLDIRFPDPLSIPTHQDPRLILAGNRFFIVYNNILLRDFKPEIRRMFIVEVSFDGKGFYTNAPEYLRYYEAENPARSDKNWVPFDFEGQLLLARFIQPHWILQPILGTGACPTFAKTNCTINWGWGDLRGGTPALLINPDEYLAFFHSSVNLPSLHSNGKVVQHYFMGAYTFSSHPPFQLLRVSAEPIIGKNFYCGLEYQTWKPLHVVFPGGFIFDDQYIWIAYGRQDHEIWIAKLDKQRFFNSLIPVSPVNP